jgi:hypothetical protein
VPSLGEALAWRVIHDKMPGARSKVVSEW